jgi:Flp pilus assembly protein TadD
MRRILLCLAGLGALSILPACKHYNAASAEYHQERATNAAAEGNYGTAEEQQRKADIARRKAETEKF